MNHKKLDSFVPMAERLEHLTMGADSNPSLCLNQVATFVKDILSRSTKKGLNIFNDYLFTRFTRKNVTKTF